MTCRWQGVGSHSAREGIAEQGFQGQVPPESWLWGLVFQLLPQLHEASQQKPPAGDGKFGDGDGQCAEKGMVGSDTREQNFPHNLHIQGSQNALAVAK